MLWENIQAVLAAYWPVPAGLCALFGVAAFNFYRLRRPVAPGTVPVVTEKLERLAYRARA
jgi:hypothetical protein